MEQRCRRPVLQGALKVLNQRANRDLQQRLNMLDKQHKFTCKMLQQRRTATTREGRKVVMVKLCEPKATVGVAMRDIQEHQDTERRFGRDVHTSDGGRGRRPSHGRPPPPSRSVSAPPAAEAAAQPGGSVRRRGNVQSNMSLMQMKNIAKIDSISEKELRRKQQEAREQTEKLKQLQRETLHEKVTEFIEQLRDKSRTQIVAEPP